MGNLNFEIDIWNVWDDKENAFLFEWLIIQHIYGCVENALVCRWVQSYW